MATYQSKYRELSFYVNGKEHAFSSGTYTTDDAEVIETLDGLVDAVRIEEQTEETEAAAPKAPKAAAKASAK